MNPYLLPAGKGPENPYVEQPGESPAAVMPEDRASAALSASTLAGDGRILQELTSQIRQAEEDMRRRCLYAVRMADLGKEDAAWFVQRRIELAVETA